MHAGAVLGGAPIWVWLLLAALIALGGRRLRTREVPVVVALIPAIAFFAWSVFGANGYAAIAGAATAAIVWVGGFAAGMLSAAVVPEARGVRVPGGHVRQPGSAVPLSLYLAVFVARFACAAWAATHPAQAVAALGAGVAIGSAMTGRLVANIARWRHEA